MVRISVCMNTIYSAGNLCHAPWIRHWPVYWTFNVHHLAFCPLKCFHLRNNQSPRAGFSVICGNSHNVVLFKKKLMAATDISKMESKCLSDGINRSDGHPIKTNGPPHIFSTLHFDKVSIEPGQVTEGVSKKRKLHMDNVEFNCDNLKRESELVTKKRRLVLSQNLLEKVSDYVRGNADKVPLPKCDAYGDSLELDIHDESQDSETKLRSLTSVLRDEASTGDDSSDLPKSQIPSPSDSCLGHPQDVYDISSLFTDHSTEEYDLKSRKKLALADQKLISPRKHFGGKQDDQNAGAGRKRPNYFVAIQVKNPQIHRGLALVQQHIKEQEPLLSLAMIPLATLHFTLMVLYLDREDIPRARLALSACGDKLKQLTSDPLVLTVSGIGNFRNDVVFANVREGDSKERLQAVAACVSGCFAEHDLLSTDKKGFQPHLTIMKLSRAPKLRKKGMRKIEPTLYEELTDTTFGKQTLTGLQLCAMCLPKDEHGYYHVEQDVQFVSDTYEEQDILFSDQSRTPESVTSRRIVKEAVTSAIHKLRIQELKRSREKKLSAKSETKAKHALQSAINALNSEQQMKMSANRKWNQDNRKPEIFIVELERELAWKFEKGEDPSKEYIISILKNTSKKS